MKFIYTLIALTLFAVQIHAQQTYTEKLRQNEAGKGTVIINQSPEIEQVVNGKVQQKSETKGRITALPATGDKPVTTGTSTNEGKISHHTTATSHTSTSHATATNASKKAKRPETIQRTMYHTVATLHNLTPISIVFVTKLAATAFASLLEATRVLISRRRSRWAKNAVLNFQNWLLIPALKHHVGSHTLATLRLAKMPTNMSAKYAAHASLTKYASLQAKWTFPIKLE